MCVVPSGKPLVGRNGCGHDRLSLCERDGRSRDKGREFGEADPSRRWAKSKATATREGKTCAPALTFRHGCPIVRFRYSCNPGGDFEAQADTNTMWGPTVGDHMAVMGSPIGGCRMGPSG